MNVTASLSLNVEHYRYACPATRMQKQTKAAGRQQQVCYLPGLEIHTDHRLQRDTGILRVITVKGVRVLHWDADNYQQRFSHTDRNESSKLELDENGKTISREGYYPFGGTALWEADHPHESRYKVMRYGGKERDLTGLMFYGYRYYAPWLMRWLNTDPDTTVDGLNLFRMVRNSPVTLTDQDGRSPGRRLARGMAITAIIGLLGAMAVELLSANHEEAEQYSLIMGAMVLVAGLSFVAKEMHEYFKLEEEKLKLRNIKVLAGGEDHYPAFTYNLNEHDRTLFFHSQSDASGKGEPFFNGAKQSAEELNHHIKLAHPNFDSGYDTFVMNFPATPKKAQKYGEKLRDITRKNILLYLEPEKFGLNDPMGLLKRTQNTLEEGWSAMAVTDRLQEEQQRTGRSVYRNISDEKGRFMFLPARNPT